MDHIYFQVAGDVTVISWRLAACDLVVSRWPFGGWLGFGRRFVVRHQHGREVGTLMLVCLGCWQIRCGVKSPG